MATTTNYSWQTPDDSALVKDGASAIRTLGSSIDTTTKNLNPETTLGDIAYRSSTANVNTRLPLGTANQQLRVNAGATAPEWFTPAAAASGLTLINRTTFSASSGFNLDSIFSATYENYLIRIQATSSADGALIKGQGRYSATTETGAVYYSAYSGTQVDSDTQNYLRSEATTSWNMGRMSNSGTLICNAAFNLYRINGSGQLTANGQFNASNSGAFVSFSGSAYISQARTYDGIRITPASGTFTGQISVYGMASA